MVDRVVAATFDELSRVGYSAMRVEDIAARSGVNKTTIYRRWPTKAELLTSAVIESSKQRVTSVDTGSLRRDLHASLSAAFKLRPYEQGVLRVIQMERAVEAVGDFAQRMRDELRETRLAMVRRGVARGELPAGTDVALVVELISAPIQRALLFNEHLDSASIDRLLDIVLAGAAADATARKGARRSTTVRKRVTSRSAAAARPAKKR